VGSQPVVKDLHRIQLYPWCLRSQNTGESGTVAETVKKVVILPKRSRAIEEKANSPLHTFNVRMVRINPTIDKRNPYSLASHNDDEYSG
jgi:hypothetical protein